MGFFHGLQCLSDILLEIRCREAEENGKVVPLDLLRSSVPAGDQLHLHNYSVEGENLW